MAFSTYIKPILQCRILIIYIDVKQIESEAKEIDFEKVLHFK